MTLLKFMRKVLKIPIQKQLKPDDYLQKQIPVFDEIENFIQDFFPENNKQLSVAAFRWFEEWRNWKELQEIGRAHV